MITVTSKSSNVNFGSVFLPSLTKKLMLYRKENFGLSSWPKLNSKRHQCFRGQRGSLLPGGTANLTSPAIVHNS